MPRLVDAAVDGASEVLDERTVESGIDLPDAKILVDDDACGAHRCTIPSLQMVTFVDGPQTRDNPPLSIFATSDSDFGRDHTGRRWVVRNTTRRVHRHRVAPPLVA